MQSKWKKLFMIIEEKQQNLQIKKAISLKKKFWHLHKKIWKDNLVSLKKHKSNRVVLTSDGKLLDLTHKFQARLNWKSHLYILSH